MWPFKSRIYKLTRDEVVDSICQLEQESNDLHTAIVGAQPKIDSMYAEARLQTNPDMKHYYARKIKNLYEARRNDIERAFFLEYNITLLNKLKTAVENNNFFKAKSNAPLMAILKDSKNLAKFLNDSLNTRLKAEDILTDADATFREVDEMFQDLKSDDIYGVNPTEDEILAQIEGTTEDFAFGESAKEAPKSDIAEGEGT